MEKTKNKRMEFGNGGDRVMTPISVGIIGQGRSGHDIHAVALSRMPQLFKIVAIADPDEQNRGRSVQEFGCDAYEDHTKLLDRKDLDLIVNASPSHMHVPLSREFLEHGFHVLCEKPLARSVADVDVLIEASRKSGKVLGVFQQARFSPGFQKMNEIVNSGVLGRIVHIKIFFNSFSRRWDWQTLQANDGGNLLNRGPHPLDQALKLMGAEAVPEITCFMDRVNTYGDAEDFVKLVMSSKGRPIVEVEISSCDAYPQTNYQVSAQYGGIIGTSQKLSWKYFSPELAPKQELIRDPLKNSDGTPSYGLESLAWTEQEWEVPEAIKDVSHHMSEAYYTNLHAAIVEGAELEVTLRQVRDQVAVIQECHRQNPLSRLMGDEQ